VFPLFDLLSRGVGHLTGRFRDHSLTSEQRARREGANWQAIFIVATICLLVYAVAGTAPFR
jgi:hypothetical protein